MTWALCSYCGAIKFGALCKCPECGCGSSGNMDLDIQFSDHYLERSTLEGFGSIIKRIKDICDDNQTRALVFLYYVYKNYPKIIGEFNLNNISLGQKARMFAILSKLDLPRIEVKKPKKEGLRWLKLLSHLLALAICSYELYKIVFKGFRSLRTEDFAGIAFVVILIIYSVSKLLISKRNRI